jgi:hypothetical protein
MNATITATNNLGETLTARRDSDNKWHASVKTQRGFTFAHLINEGPAELRKFARDFDFDLEGLVG